MSQNPNNLICGKYSLSLNRPLIMGILNVTPDSFSDGGSFQRIDLAIEQAKRMVDEGADIIDIGGESTRPGAKSIDADEELQRVIPVIEKISSLIDVPISIDTSKAIVMAEAVKAGASMINDVCALQQENALEVAAKLNVPVCLMHMQGKPRNMQDSVEYVDVVAEVYEFLMQRVQACLNAGMHKTQIIIDPGFGFGKTLQNNLDLLQSLKQFTESEYPVLVGISRKSMLGSITGKPVEQRVTASVVAALKSIELGAKIVRVHDVAETKDALTVWQTFS